MKNQRFIFAAILCALLFLPTVYAATINGPKECTPPCCIFVGTPGTGPDRYYRCKEAVLTCACRCYAECLQQNGEREQRGVCSTIYFSTLLCKNVSYNVSESEVCLDPTTITCSESGATGSTVDPCLQCEKWQGLDCIYWSICREGGLPPL